MRTFLFSIIVLALTACGKPSADFIIHHAVIYTVDSSFSVASAMAIKDGKIIATGSNEAIMDAYRADSLQDAGGAAIFPGWIDAAVASLKTAEMKKAIAALPTILPPNGTSTRHLQK